MYILHLVLKRKICHVMSCDLHIYTYNGQTKYLVTVETGVMSTIMSTWCPGRRGNTSLILSSRVSWKCPMTLARSNVRSTSNRDALRWAICDEYHWESTDDQCLNINTYTHQSTKQLTEQTMTLKPKKFNTCATTITTAAQQAATCTLANKWLCHGRGTAQRACQ